MVGAPDRFCFLGFSRCVSAATCLLLSTWRIYPCRLAPGTMCRASPFALVQLRCVMRNGNCIQDPAWEDDTVGAGWKLKRSAQRQDLVHSL